VKRKGNTIKLILIKNARISESWTLYQYGSDYYLIVGRTRTDKTDIKNFIKTTGYFLYHSNEYGNCCGKEIAGGWGVRKYRAKKQLEEHLNNLCKLINILRSQIAKLV